jgi:catechol 2,3-dioxygenase-like lactoylglutathione lyase family enzyme
MTVRRMVVDHVLLVVRDLEVSRCFYRAALAPLGLDELAVSCDGVSFGAEGLDDFAIFAGRPSTSGAHVAFDAPSRWLPSRRSATPRTPPEFRVPGTRRSGHRQ